MKKTVGLRGSVLVHVLVTALIVALIAVEIGQMMLQHHNVVGRMKTSMKNKALAMTAYNWMISAWSQTGVRCQDFGTAPDDYHCHPGNPADHCDCICKAHGNPADPVIVANMVAGNCEITITTPDTP